MVGPTPPRPRFAFLFGAVHWGALWTWLLGFALVLYLGFNGGGYDPLVSDQAGIAAWWILLAAVAVGALPRERPRTVACVALALLAAFVAWTALSVIWTESAERTTAELARVATYLGVFALAVFSRGPAGARLMIGAVATAIAVLGVVALLSRLHPSWFPDAAETGRFLSTGRERLSYPLNYWNALATLIAIGLPLLLSIATESSRIAVRSVAAAAMPALMLAAFLTLSRAGIAACFLAVLVFFVFAGDRLPKLAVLLLTAAGGATLILSALSKDALRDGLGDSVAREQGDQLLVLAVAACLLVGLAVAAFSRVLTNRRRPRWTQVSPRSGKVAVGIAAVALLIAFAAVDGPGRASQAWDDFKQPTGGPGKGVERLSDASGESRYQFWEAAVDAAGSAPLTGTGAGTFEYWWNRHAVVPGTIRDAHSLYMQTLGETGIVGLALLAGFLLTLLIGGGRAALTVPSGRRGPLAAALAGCVAFCFTAIFDWMWQIPVLPACLLLLGSVFVTAGREPASVRGRELGWVPRVAVAVASLAAIVAIAIPLAASSLLRQSQDEAREGDFKSALGSAKSAENVEPFAAAPRLQQALLYEQLGDLARASEAATVATEKEETNWENWLILARIETQRGNADAAVAAYEKARELNPKATVFEAEDE